MLQTRHQRISGSLFFISHKGTISRARWQIYVSGRCVLNTVPNINRLYFASMILWFHTLKNAKVLLCFLQLMSRQLVKLNQRENR